MYVILARRGIGQGLQFRDRNDRNMMKFVQDGGSWEIKQY